MAGTLYLVGTPIGNLEDISERALRTLREVDLIACEDTRTSGNLLRHFGITTPTTSYHKFNEEEKGDELIGRLLGGTDIALITDAGMPAISDPGESLVRKCHENGVVVTAAPGPTAVTTALALSGRATRRFAFEGFLPQENKEKAYVLGELKQETRTIVLYEAPHRLLKTLRELEETLGGDRGITVTRELTKKFETVTPTTIAEAVAETELTPPRGEYVLVIDGKSREEMAAEQAARWETMDIPSHVAMYEAQGMSRKDAMKAAAKDRGVSRRDIYQALLGSEHNEAD
ncbi:MAG: 16S rRNA (cytidine(1402)-2'-O)-methyltransferase [Chordicoccus sp.]